MRDAGVMFLIALLVAAAVLLLGGAGILGAGMMGGGMMGGAMLGMPLLSGLFMLGLPVLFFGAVAALILAVARGAGSVMPPGAPPQSDPAPLAILKVRFAKGEINQEQFTEMRRQLGV